MMQPVNNNVSKQIRSDIYPDVLPPFQEVLTHLSQHEPERLPVSE